MFNKTICKNKKLLCTEDEEIYLEINGEQSVKLESVTIKFKNYFKQIALPFKICADFESLLKDANKWYRQKHFIYWKISRLFPLQFCLQNCMYLR